MDLNPFFRSIVDQDTAPVVICNAEHYIVYMNPAAVERYRKRGGADLVGRCIFDCHVPASVERIRRTFAWFSENTANNIRYMYYFEKTDSDVYMVALRGEDSSLIGYYEKHESRRHEQHPDRTIPG